MREQRFTITEEHLKLLRNMEVEWDDCEFGAPCIDPKRPYGNSDVISDMGEILGIEATEKDDWGDQTYSTEQQDRLRHLHSETETALQIILRTGEFATGTYVVADPYSTNWKRAT